MIALVPLAEVSHSETESLLDRAFGPGRRARTAYRVREGMAPIPELSFAALRDNGAVAGVIQSWPVAIHCDSGGSVPMIMVGPVAVDPRWQNEGLGRALMERMLEAANERGPGDREPLMLIGDPEYYGRFFGFSAERTRGWRLPGPWEPHRLLARGNAAPDRPGVLGPRVRLAA